MPILDMSKFRSNNGRFTKKPEPQDQVKSPRRRRLSFVDLKNNFNKLRTPPKTFAKKL
jgi:hypothetical protein